MGLLTENLAASTAVMRSMPAASGESGTDRATLLAAIIAAVVALIAAGLALWGNIITSRAAKAAAAREYTLRQLNDFYGPIYMRRQLSERLHRQLDPPAPPGAAPSPSPSTHGGPGQWRLVDHIAEIQAETDPFRQTVVEQILEIDDELSELIIGRAGLIVESPPPPVLDEFLEHVRTLHYLWDRSENATPRTYKPFPNGFDPQIESSTTTLRARLK